MVRKGKTHRVLAVTVMTLILMTCAGAVGQRISAQAETLLILDSEVPEMGNNGTVDGIEAQERSNPEEDETAADGMDSEGNTLLTSDLLNSMKTAEIRYNFGSVSEKLDWNTTKDWIRFTNKWKLVLDQTQIRAYILKMAEKYDTRRRSVDFLTSSGRTVTFSAGQHYYGFEIDKEGEYEQLLFDLAAGAFTEREPVYIRVDSLYQTPLCYERDGMDDLAGTYVEVDLTSQHLWFYKGGELVIDTPVVTGSVALQKETIPGIYPIAYRKQDAVLKGQGYTQPVSYWMPFNEGQGLHDAPWRSSFGGEIYKTDGSHGCVNMPPEAARIVFENAKAGMAVVLYR